MANRLRGTLRVFRGARRGMASSSFSINDINEVKQARGCVAISDWMGATQLLDQAKSFLASVPDLQRQVQIQIADVYQLKGDLQAEIKARRELLAMSASLQTHALLATTSLAVALVRGGDVSDAIEVCDKALQEYSDENPRVQTVRALALSHHESRYGEAIEALDELIGRVEGVAKADALLVRCRCISKLKGEDEATLAYREVEEMCGTEPDLAIQIAIAQSSQSTEEKLNASIKEYEKEGRELFLANALRLLALVRMAKGDGVVAEGLFRSVQSKLTSYKPDSIFRKSLLVAFLRDYAGLLEVCMVIYMCLEVCMAIYMCL
ncbi:hypothetical protein AAMO2058_000939100 [Amorphochlora amoebiformis]